MPNKVFVDTAGWTNLFVATESYHRQATEWFSIARQRQVEMVTTNYVVTELVALFNSPLRVTRPRLFAYLSLIEVLRTGDRPSYLFFFKKRQ
ncbi:MAG: hypothetical protein AB4426_12250 [Xenococcaceae cyanobacterium]